MILPSSTSAHRFAGSRRRLLMLASAVGVVSAAIPVWAQYAPVVGGPTAYVPPNGFSPGFFINDSGNAVETASTDAVSLQDLRPVRWDPDGSSLELPNLASGVNAIPRSQANGINSNGYVVGHSAQQVNGVY